MKQTNKSQAILALAAAIALFLTTAVVVLHSHDDLAGRMCQACKVAQFPVMELDAGPAVQALAPVPWSCPPARPALQRDPLFAAEPGRAPPA
jgi:hypothetical protein